MTALKRCGLVLITVLLAVFIMLWAVLSTEIGFTTFFRVLEKALPALQTKEVKGSIFDGFVIKELRFDSEALGFSVTSLSSKLQWRLLSQFEVPYCEVDAPSFTIKKISTTTEPSEPLTRIDLPLSVTLTSLSIRQARFIMPGMNASVGDFTGGAKISGSTLLLTPIAITDIAVNTVSMSDEKKPTANPSVSSGKPVTSFPDSFKIDLPDIVVPLDINVASVEIKNVIFNRQQSVSHVLLKATTEKNEITLSQLAIELPKGELNASGDMTLSGDFPVSLSVKAVYQATPTNAQHVALEIEGSLKALLIKGELEGLCEATLDGEVDVTVENLPFSLNMVSKQLVWPLDKTPDYQLLNNQLHFKGKLTDYQLDYYAQFKSPHLPDATFSLKAEGNLQEAQLQALNLDILGGKVVANATVKWADKFVVDAEVKIQELHPENQWAAVNGVVSGDLRFEMNEEADGTFSFMLKPLLSGQLNQQALALTGDVIGKIPQDASIEVNFEKINFHHGDNRMNISGRIADQWSLQVDTYFSDLHDSVPDMHGNIHGKIDIKGRRKAPVITSDLTVEQLNIQDTIQLSSGKLAGTLSLDESTASNFSLNVSKARMNAIDFNRLELRIKGVLSNHHLSLNLAGEPVSFDAKIDGALVDDGWAGTLLSSKGTFGKETLTLDRKVAISVSAKEGVIFSKHCWKQPKGSVCLVDDAIINDSGHLGVKVTHIDMGEWLAPFLTEHQELNAVLNADVAMSWENKRLKTLNGKAALLPGSYQQPLSETNFNIGWHTFALTVENQNQLLKTHLAIALTNDGRIEGDVSVDSSKEDPQLTGDIQLTHLELEKLKPFLPFYQVFEGDIDSHVQLSGTLNDPVVKGNLRLLNVKATGEDAPFIVERGQCVINFNQTKASIDAEFMNEAQPLRLKGDVTWDEIANWQLQAVIDGDKLKVKKKPLLTIELAPHLSIKADAKGASIEGKVDIPRALIQVKKLPSSAVSVSEDEVIIKSGTSQQDTKKKTNFDLQSLVTINIGKDVKIDALGLKGNLTGKLLVKMKDNQPMVFGDLFIKNGTYRAFAQSLIIQEGRLLFNGPATQPYLSIKAVRDPKSMKDDVVAGVQVSGPADKPKIDFFSDPTMPQQNIISYILTGKDIDEDIDANSAMTIMLISMGLAKSNKMMSNIGDKVGIKDLALNAEGGGDESQVTVSGYIAPGLQVKYGVGVFKTITEFTVRYQLMKRLFLEAVSSSEDSSLDLLYQFSFGHIQKQAEGPSLQQGLKQK